MRSKIHEAALKTFAEFLDPVPIDAFRSRHLGQAPLHIPGSAAKARAVAGWADFNAMLGMESHWTESTLRLVLNSHPVYPEHYIDEVQGVGGPFRRASPAKVALFAAMGASIVANDVQDVSLTIRSVAAMLGEALMGRANANIYCSFQDIQAFSAHYDLHEVFALQCEGEKVWRLYSGREDNPVDPPPLDEASKTRMDRDKGRMIAEVAMSAGDILYIPRGCYHDAVASSEASLHVTFSVTPLNGRDMLSALVALASQSSQFRAYLPDHRLNAGADLQAHLGRLAAGLSDLCRSSAFIQDVAALQRGTHRPAFEATLPDRPELHWFEIRDGQARVEATPNGAQLVTTRGRVALGAMREPAAWMLSRPAFSVEEAAARYPHFPRAEIAGLTDLLARSGVVGAYKPALGS